MPNRLEKRRQGYYAVLWVPASVREKIRTSTGKPRKKFRVSLETQDKATALRRAPRIVAEWQTQIALARGDEEALEDDAVYAKSKRVAEIQHRYADVINHWRPKYAKAKTDAERDAIFKDMVEFDLEDIRDPEYWGRNEYVPEDEDANVVAAAITDTPTTRHLNEWLGSIDVKPKTADMRRATIKRLAVKFPTIDKVTKREVRRWATELGEKLSSATVQRMLTDCRTYWHYLATIELVPDAATPFDRLGLKRATVRPRKAWAPEDLVKLLRAAEAKGGPMADLIWLAMYSGARLGELVNLRTEDVHGRNFTITAAKTEAGKRDVPIHPAVKETFDRLGRTKGKTDYLLPRRANGKHPVDIMSKAFRRLRISQGYDDDRLVFHSIRATFITMMERAGVPEHITQDIVGHERSTLTGNTYSGKSTMAQRAEEIAKLEYPS